MRSMRAGMASLLAVVMVAAGCGERIYEAEVSGYVRDAVSEEGIDGARVRIYFNDTDDSYQETYTQNYNQSDGYFVFRRVVWSSWTPAFGDEGDLADIRLAVEQEDYLPFETELRLVSDASNAVGDVQMDRRFFVSERIEGRVRDREEDRDDENPGINGLDVELYVPDVELTDAAEIAQWVMDHNPDDVASTTTSEEEPGFFSFEDVRWKKEGLLPEGEEERGTPRKVILRVKDIDHFTLLVPEVTIYSGETATVLDDIYVDKMNYQGDVEGFVTDVSTGDGLNGVSVDVYVPDVSLADQAAVELWVEDHDPVASANTQTDDDEEDGYYLVTGVDWEVEEQPPADVMHQETPIILVLNSGGYRERIIYDNDDAAGFEPYLVCTSNRERRLPTFALNRTDFQANLEGYVRLYTGTEDSGENGVQIYLYYDPDDPDLSELEAFDPFEADFNDQTSTQDHDVRDETYSGYFSFQNIGWDRDEGGTLEGGRDTASIILYSKGVDFSGFEGNEDPSWQRFTIVSDDGDDEQQEREDFNTTPDLQFRPTQFNGAFESYIRQNKGDFLSGQNGVEVKLYYDENDPDLSELVITDIAELEWVDETTTQNDTTTQASPGYFAFNDLFWRNPQGPSVGLDRDRLTVIVYSEGVDFSEFQGNSDPRWQRFTVTSGEDADRIPDLQFFPVEFTGSLEAYVREKSGESATGENGIELKLYYDPDDRELTGLTAFDPTTVDFVDVVSTRDREVGEETYPGYFRFEDLYWRNLDGPSLAGGRDQLTLIVYSPDVDFSGFEGNEDPSWQRFTVTSGENGNTLPDLKFLPPPTPFSASVEGFVRAVVGDDTSGENGVTLKLYYDPDDPDLGAAASFDPATASFVDQVSTESLIIGETAYEGAFSFANIEWERPGGPTLGNGKDVVNVILYSPRVDFSGFDGNTDPTWQVFELVSGEDGNTLSDLLFAP